MAIRANGAHAAAILFVYRVFELGVDVVAHFMARNTEPFGISCHAKPAAPAPMSTPATTNAIKEIPAPSVTLEQVAQRRFRAVHAFLITLLSL